MHIGSDTNWHDLGVLIAEVFSQLKVAALVTFVGLIGEMTAFLIQGSEILNDEFWKLWDEKLTPRMRQVLNSIRSARHAI